MPVDRHLWKTDYTQGRFMSWRCAECGGKVALRGEITEVEAAISVQAHDHEAWEPHWIVGSFMAMLHCGDCNDPAVVAGGFVGDEYYGEHDLEVFHRYEPNFIDPPPQLISIPGATPESITDELLKAFSLFWTDAEACANRLRSAVERILDDQRVRKFQNKDSRRIRLSLHQRLDLLRATKPDVSEILMAAKWIGNAGSHGSGLEREDLFDGFDLLEHALLLIYSDGNAIKRIAKKINRRKKPTGRPGDARK